MQSEYPEDVMKLAEEALDNLLCNCTASCGGYDGLRAASISDIARAIMQDRASRSCLLEKPEAVEATSPQSNVVGDPVVPITTGMPEVRVSLIARAVRQSLRNYGHKVAESTLPECIAGDVERTLAAHEKTWTPAKPPRDCGINGGDLSESRDNIGSAYTRSTPSPQSRVTPADTDAAQSGGEAFDKIVAARKVHVDAVAAYNARLEFVRAERERGNWLNVDPEYATMSEAQSAFYRTVQELADAALSASPSPVDSRDALIEAAWQAYQNCPVDLCGDHDEEQKKAVVAAVNAVLPAEEQQP